MPTNLQLPMSLSSLNSKLNKRRGWEGGTGTVPAVEVCTGYTWQCQTSRVLSVAEFQGLCPWQRGAGKAEKCLSPALHSQHVLGRRGGRGAHSSV